MHIQHRTLWKMILLMVVTVGIYSLYWLYVTKRDLNTGSAPKIPTFFLFFIPFANFYFLYKFAESFCINIVRDRGQTIGYFLLLTLLFPVGLVVCQHMMNSTSSRF